MYEYKFKITTKSPIHIGTGEAYEPTNFVIDKNTFYAFDEMLFYQSLNQMDKNALNSKMQDWISIIGFYKSKVQVAKNIAKFSCHVSQKVASKYSNLNNKDCSKNTNQFIIDTSFKNPNTFRAIIPGSSIKGVFDTVLKIYPPKSDNKQRAKLKISDALLLSGNTEIGISYRKHKKPDKEAKSDIPQMLEIIKENSTFICQVSSPYSIEQIKQEVDKYYSLRDGSYKQIPKGFMLRVGKYSGKEFVVDNINDAINTYNKPIATHTLYESGDKPFGWIEFVQISDEEYQKSLLEIKAQEDSYFADLKHKQKSIRESIAEEKLKLATLLKEKKEAKEAEALLEKQKEDEEKNKLNSMSDFKKAIYNLEKQNNSNTPLATIILKNVEDGKLDEFKFQALEEVKKLLIQTNKWKEQTNAKKPAKDKDYQRTIKIMQMLKESKD